MALLKSKRDLFNLDCVRRYEQHFLCMDLMVAITQVAEIVGSMPSEKGFLYLRSGPQTTEHREPR